MKIAFLTDGIYPYVLGGMQRHSTNMIKHLVLNGTDVTLFHAINNGCEIPSEQEVNIQLFGNQNSCKVSSVGINFPKSFQFPGHYIFNSKRYSSLVYEKLIQLNISDFDFIYVKGFSGWKLISEKKRNRFPKIGVNFHGYEMWQYAPTLKSKFIQYMLRPFVKSNMVNSDVVFSYGSKITDLIESVGISKENIIELPSAIDEKWIRNSTIEISDQIKFLFIGRYERRKAIEEINQAIQQTSRLKLNMEFHFIGPIPDSKKIISKNVIYHGKLTKSENIISIIDSCDVLMCPSFSEGMPNVILEAMSRGLAIIATNVGAVSLLVNSDNGMLIDNNVKSLLDALIYFNNLDKQELIKLKKQSILKVKEDFVWDKVVRDFISKISCICQE